MWRSEDPSGTRKPPLRGAGAWALLLLGALLLALSCGEEVDSPTTTTDGGTAKEDLSSAFCSGEAGFQCYKGEANGCCEETPQDPECVAGEWKCTLGQIKLEFCAGIGADCGALPDIVTPPTDAGPKVDVTPVVPPPDVTPVVPPPDVTPITIPDVEPLPQPDAPQGTYIDVEPAPAACSGGWVEDYNCQIDDDLGGGLYAYSCNCVCNDGSTATCTGMGPQGSQCCLSGVQPDSDAGTHSGDGPAAQEDLFIQMDGGPEPVCEGDYVTDYNCMTIQDLGGGIWLYSCDCICSDGSTSTCEATGPTGSQCCL